MIFTDRLGHDVDVPGEAVEPQLKQFLAAADAACGASTTEPEVENLRRGPLRIHERARPGGGPAVTLDVHQQRQAARPSRGRRCMSCGVYLYEGEVARMVDKVWKRLDVCIQCDTNGPPRRPHGAPAPLESPAAR